ncbi:MAG: hypothetical protein ACHQ50_01170 [Fimbriimonadales bacterium]
MLSLDQYRAILSTMTTLFDSAVAAKTDSGDPLLSGNTRRGLMEGEKAQLLDQLSALPSDAHRDYKTDLDRDLERWLALLLAR